MLTRHATRKRLSVWMVGVLLCVQWWVAAYGCPLVGQVHASAHEWAAVPEPLADCHGMATTDTESPTLCKAHCDADQQAPAQPASHEAPAPALAGFFVAPIVCAADGLAQAGFSAVPRAGAPPGWPPLYLIHGVLRN